MTEIAFTGDIAFSKYFTGRADDEQLLSPAILSFLKNNLYATGNARIFG